MKRRELLIDQGGLMRCCLQSIVDWIAEDPEAEAVPGQKISCRFERENPAQMIVSGRVIEWLDPDYPPIPKATP